MKRIRNLIIKLFMWTCNLFFFSKNKIIFQSFGGDNYSENPRVIFELILQQSRFKNVKTIWVFKNPKPFKTILPKGTKVCKINSIKFFFHLATAKIWIDNFEKPIFLKKNKRQVYIQTFHGDRGFKKIINDVFPKKRLEENYCDYIITGSTYAEKVMTTAFNYHGKFLKIGSPRNDLLFTNDSRRISDVKTKLNINLDCNVLMYAPTFRDSQLSSVKDIHSIGPLKKLLTFLGSKTTKNWVLLIRSHPGRNEFVSLDSSEYVIDVSSYEDMAELLLITDFLVSDYSSCAGDFILMDKPVVLYQYDVQSYLTNDRQFYFDVNETDFLVAYNEKELLDKAAIAIFEDSSLRNQRILDFYGAYESGTATQTVLDKINEIMNL